MPKTFNIRGTKSSTNNAFGTVKSQKLRMFVTDIGYGQNSSYAVLENTELFTKLDRKREHWQEILDRKERQIEHKQSALKNQLEKEYKLDHSRSTACANKQYEFKDKMAMASENFEKVKERKMQEDKRFFKAK